MGVGGYNLTILAMVLTLGLATSTHREKPLVTASALGPLDALESRRAERPGDAAAVHELAQAYLAAHSTGMAIATIERASAEARRDPELEHLYARALIEQGRSHDALAAESRVLHRCVDEEAPCSSHLIASATRRRDVLQELVRLGVEDAASHPEASQLAYWNAIRSVSLVVQ